MDNKIEHPSHIALWHPLHPQFQCWRQLRIRSTMTFFVWSLAWPRSASCFSNQHWKWGHWGVEYSMGCSILSSNDGTTGVGVLSFTMHEPTYMCTYIYIYANLMYAYMFMCVRVYIYIYIRSVYTRTNIYTYMLLPGSFNASDAHISVVVRFGERPIYMQARRFTSKL